MSVSYVYNDLVISVPKEMLEDGESGPLAVSNDLILLSRSSGVTDSSQCSAKYTWEWINNASYRDTGILHLLSGSSALTVGGDYSGTSNKYNLKIVSNNVPYETAAVRANGDLRLVLVAQTGAAGAAGLDKNISISVKSTVTRNHEKYLDSIAASNQTTVMGYDISGTLVVSSDLLGTIKAVSTAGLSGIQVKSGDKYEAANTSSNQKLDAIGIRAGNTTLVRNFTATINAQSTASIAGYASQTVSGNSLSAKGLRILGDLSATTAGGQWGGTITATATAEAYADKDHLFVDSEGKTPDTNTATVSNNDFSAYGIWADGEIAIRHMATGKISASTENTKINAAAAAAADGTGTLNLSGNLFSAYGIKSDSVNIGQIDSGFSIAASIAGTTVTGSVSGKERVATLSGNKFEAIGIDTPTLTVDTFDGKVSASAKNVSFTVTGRDNDHTVDDTAYHITGVSVGKLTATDNFGGTITVSSSSVSGIGYYDKFSSMLRVAGIYANDYMLVTGRINTSITVTMSKNQGFGGNPQAFGIYAKALAADAFSGSITVTAPLDLGLMHYVDHKEDVVKSAGLTVGALTTTTMVTYGVMDAFDINGDIVSTLAGLVAIGEVNLRVSGKISTEGFSIADVDGMAITTDYGNASSTNADKVELASTAVVKGNIDLAGGENTLVINSGAQVDGKLLAANGLMNIRFDLDETVRSNAIVKTTLDDISLGSTSTISINLNNAKDGATYTLFEYASTSAKNYWTSGTKQVTFSYMGQSEVMNVSAAGTATGTFTDAAGNVVSATLTYSGKKVTVAVTNGCSLEEFGGERTTTLDSANRTATLAWSDAVDAENYEVEYSIDGGKTIVVMVTGSRNSVTINGIDAGTKINWRVRGNTGDGSEVSAWSDWSGNESYEPAVLEAPVMADATPRAVNPDEEGGGVTASRARFTWEAASGDSEISRYDAEFIVSKTLLTPDEIAAIYADPGSIAGDESKRFFRKQTTATEVVATTLTNQSYVYWRVKAVDVTGKESEFKDGESFRIWVGDNVKPVWRKLADDETDRATAIVDYDRKDAYDVKLNVDFTWISATDSQSGVKSYLLQYKRSGDSWLDETKVYSVTVAEDGSKTYGAKLENLAGGLYDYRIKAVDYVGNESEYLVTSQFGASDLTPPSGKFSSFSTPVVTGTWTEPDTTSGSSDDTTSTSTTPVLTGLTVKLGWSDTFTDDSDIIYTVEISDNADFLGKRVYSFETSEKSLTLDDSVGTASAVLAGMSTVYYRVSVKDSVGNANPLPSATQSFRMVDSSTGDTISFSPAAATPTGLSMSKSKVAVGSSYRTNLTFKWSDGDNSFGVYDYTLSVTANGTTTKYTGITGNSYTLSNQVDGNYSWKVTANTGTGSSATATGTAFTIDATAPVFAESAKATVSTVLGEFAINWDAATDKSGIQGYILQYGSGLSTSTWTSVALTTTSYKGTISSSGDYNYRIYAVDKYNNTSLEAQSFLQGSFTISTARYDTSDLAKTLAVTDIREDAAPSSGSVGLGLAAEWLKFTVGENDADVYLGIDDVVSSYNKGSGITVKGYAANDLKKAIFSTSVGSGDQKLQFRFAEAGTYYLEVTPKKSTSIMAYSIAAASNVPTAAEITSEDNAWSSYDSTAKKYIYAADYHGAFRLAVDHDAETGAVEQMLVDDYVGKTDAVDYRRLDVAVAGNYDFTVEGVASPLQLSIWSTTRDSLGNIASVKEVKKVTLSPKYDSKKGEWIDSASTGTLLLDKGDYYFSVTATGAKNDKNSVYQVSVKGEAFVRVNNADDDWQKLAQKYTATLSATKEDPTPSVTLFENEWVGFGDAIDYRKLTITQSGNYNFTVTGVENNTATLTLYTVNAKSGKLDKYKSVTVNGAKTASGAISDLLVDTSKGAQVFYVAVTANDAKKGKNTPYEVTVSGTGFVDANNEDDDWQDLAPKYTATLTATKEDPTPSVTLFANEWVGYGDAIDYRKLTITQTGSYNFKLSGASNSVTLTIYTENAKKPGTLSKVKAVTVNGTKTSSGEISGLLVDASEKSQVFYVAVTANDAKKAKNSYYEVTVDGTGFVDANNEDDDWKTLGEYGNKYIKTVTAPAAAPSVTLFENEWVGYGDAIDYRRLTINQTGSYDFGITGVTAPATLTIYTYNEQEDKLDKYKSVSVNGTKATSGTISGLLVEAGTTYYVAVTANDAKKAKNTNYEVTVSGTGFVEANQQVDDTWEEANAGTTATTKKILAYNAATGAVTAPGVSKNEWVGFGDVVDFREITVGAAGQYNINVSNAVNNLKLTVWALTEVKGELTAKSIKSITVNAAKTPVGEISDLLLESGTYYVSVEATDAKKGKNTNYDLAITGTGFIKGNNEDDDWQVLAPKYTATLSATKEAPTPSVTLFANEWVGYGDAIDYRKLTITQTGSYDFEITGVENSATLTIYTYNEQKDKLDKYKSVTVDGSKASKGAIAGLLVDASKEAPQVFYVAVTANNAKNAKNTPYEVTVSGTGFVDANNEDDDWQVLAPKYTVAGTTSFDDWVGYNDRIDYRAISVDPQGGIYAFGVSGLDGAGVENSVKLTVYAENNGKLKSVKSVTATVKNGAASTGDLCLAGDGKYYLAVEAPDAAKGKNSYYTLAMTERGTFTHRGNEAWDTATVLDDNVFDGVLTTAAGGDKVDCFDLAAINDLAFDAEEGKVKVSFFGADQKAVKVAEMTMADGSVKKNVSSLTLEAGNQVTDNFLIADLGEVWYLKVEAATGGLNTYRTMSLLA